MDNDVPSPETVEAYVRKAHQMRANAIRDSFAAFVASIAAGVSTISHALRIPKTDEL